MFRYETHLHTAEVSRCSISTARDMMVACKAQGYTGAIITDHFLKGNSFANTDQPWPIRVATLMKGYHAALKEGEKIGLQVFFGWEGTLEGHDFLTYGLREDFLLAHPQLSDLPVEEYCRVVRTAGGFISQAHPYREAPYIPDPSPVNPTWLDAVEAFNASDKQPDINANAKAFAAANHLLTTAGSDAHCTAHFTSGMAFDHRLENIQDFINSVRSEKYQLLERHFD